MGAAGNVVAEERLVGGEFVELVHPTDRFVGHRRRQMPARLANVGVNRCRVPGQVRLPLTRVAANETVEVLESHTDGPLVERPGLAGYEFRCVVVLAEPGRAVAIVTQDRPNRCRILADDAVVAGETGRRFRDHPEANVVMVSSGDQRCPRR